MNTGGDDSVKITANLHLKLTMAMEMIGFLSRSLLHFWFQIYRLGASISGLRLCLVSSLCNFICLVDEIQHTEFGVLCCLRKILRITTVLYLKDEITIATPGALDRYMHLFSHGIVSLSHDSCETLLTTSCKNDISDF
ncbi:unnamed protein product [Brassica oleracea]|uniref:(rape) hypothetical protein n=2 Tax=Brassica napus TaxID=3708 RepID=A0A816MA06_BRANA|nr:unnamed protein product [Brassica napus]